MNNKSLIKVALVDDNRQMLMSLQELLKYSGQIEVVIMARSVLRYLDELDKINKESFPDVTLMDIEMDEIDGIQAVKMTKLKYPSHPILMLTMFDDDDLIFEAIKSGACGYLLKDEKINIIIDHVKTLLRDGGAPMSPTIARKTFDMLMRYQDLNSNDKSIKIKTYFSLSEREVEVLKLMVDGLDYKDISSNLSISPNTVRKHITNIYSKLHVSSKAQAINLVYKSNLLN